MTDKQIFEAMARLDGFTDSMQTNLSNSPPDYLTSHDAVIRVFVGLDLFFQQNAMRILIKRVGGKRSDRESRTVVRCVAAKPRTWCEAILKALGKWEAAE